jgi:hypothetical protein
MKIIEFNQIRKILEGLIFKIRVWLNNKLIKAISFMGKDKI